MTPEQPTSELDCVKTMTRTETMLEHGLFDLASTDRSVGAPPPKKVQHVDTWNQRSLYILTRNLHLRVTPYAGGGMHPGGGGNINGGLAVGHGGQAHMGHRVQAPPGAQPQFPRFG